MDIADADPSEPRSEPLADADPAIRAARIYFGTDPMGGTLTAIEPWGPGEKPVFETDDERVAMAAPGESRPTKRSREKARSTSTPTRW